ncbi:hypothetical protein [Deinococcus sp. KNUC1210]|nr:hypothetical protein [Deinococcus sp. KNUC1210]
MNELWQGLLLPYLLMVALSFGLLALTRALAYWLWRRLSGRT